MKPFGRSNRPFSPTDWIYGKKKPFLTKALRVQTSNVLTRISTNMRRSKVARINLIRGLKASQLGSGRQGIEVHLKSLGPFGAGSFPKNPSMKVWGGFLSSRTRGIMRTAAMRQHASNIGKGAYGGLGAFAGLGRGWRRMLKRGGRF